MGSFENEEKLCGASGTERSSAEFFRKVRGNFCLKGVYGGIGGYVICCVVFTVLSDTVC